MIKPRLAGAAVRRAIVQGNENAGDTVKKTADAIKEAGANAKDAGGGARDKAVDKAKEVGKNAADKMKDFMT